MVVEAAAVAAERASGAAVAVKYVVIDLLFFHARDECVVVRAPVKSVYPCT